MTQCNYQTNNLFVVNLEDTIGLKFLRLCVILWFRVEPPLGVGGYGLDLKSLRDFWRFLKSLSKKGKIRMETAKREP